MQDGFVFGDRLGQPARQLRQRHAQIVVHLDEIRLQPESGLEFGNRVRQAARRLQPCIAERVVDFRIIGLDQ